MNVVMGSTCEAGCKAIVRIQLDQLKADGTLNNGSNARYMFSPGCSSSRSSEPVDGDVIVVGDCAKPSSIAFRMRSIGANARNIQLHTIWANRPDVGIAHYVRHLAAVQQQ